MRELFINFQYTIDSNIISIKFYKVKLVQLTSSTISRFKISISLLGVLNETMLKTGRHVVNENGKEMEKIYSLLEKEAEKGRKEAYCC